MTRRRTLAGALIGLVAGAIAVSLGYTPLLETWERRTSAELLPALPT
jgi:hypothetical protein